MKMRSVKRYVSSVTAVAMFASSAILGSTSAFAEENKAPQFTGPCTKKFNLSDKEWKDVQWAARNGYNPLPSYEDICQVDFPIHNKNDDLIPEGTKVIRVLSFHSRNGQPASSLTYQEIPNDYTYWAIAAGVTVVTIVGTAIILKRAKVRKARLAEEQKTAELTGKSQARAKQAAKQADVPKDVQLHNLDLPGDHSGRARVSGAIQETDLQQGAKIFTDKSNGKRYTTIYANDTSHIVYVYPYGSNYPPFFWDPYLGSMYHPGYVYHPVFIDTSGGAVVNPNISNPNPTFQVGPIADAPFVAGERPVQPGDTIVGADISQPSGQSTGLGTDFVVTSDGTSKAVPVDAVDRMESIKNDNLTEVTPTDDGSSKSGGDSNFTVDNKSSGGDNNFTVDNAPPAVDNTPAAAAVDNTPSYTAPPADNTPSYSPPDPPAAPSGDGT